MTERDGDTEKGCQKPAVQHRVHAFAMGEGRTIPNCPEAITLPWCLSQVIKIVCLFL